MAQSLANPDFVGGHRRAVQYGLTSEGPSDKGVGNSLEDERKLFNTS